MVTANEHDDLQRLLTVTEVADYLGCRPQTIHDYCRRGILECVQVNGRVRKFTVEQIQAFIKRRTLPVPKPIDKARANRIPSKMEEKTGGGSGRAQLKKEMRSW